MIGDDAKPRVRGLLARRSQKLHCRTVASGSVETMDHLSQVSEDFAKLGASVLESLDVSGLSRKTRGLEFKHLMYGTKLRLHYRDKYESAKAIFKTLYSMIHAFLKSSCISRTLQVCDLSGTIPVRPCS